MQHSLELIIILTVVLLVGLAVKTVPKSPSILLVVSTSIALFIIILVGLSKSLKCSKSNSKSNTNADTDSNSNSKKETEEGFLGYQELEKSNKKVRIDTNKNKEVEIETGRLPIDYQNESLNELQEISQVDYPMHSKDQRNQRDCTVDLSCIVTQDQDWFKKASKEIQGHNQAVKDHSSTELEYTGKDQDYKGYMTKAQLDGYAPSGLKYCQNFVEGFEAPLFVNSPPDEGNNTQLCRHCKVGYCLGGVCGSEILVNPSEMENYFMK